MRLIDEGAIEGVVSIRREVWRDKRGSFLRAFDFRDFEGKGIDFHIAQINVAVIEGRGTVKGMHLQKAPSREYKLVTCIVGAVADAILDLRQSSISFGTCAVHELRALDGRSLLIPPGVAHGMQNLEEYSIVLYAHSDVYRPDLESGVNPLDEFVSIPWPITPQNLSVRDSELPSLTDFSGGLDL